MNLPILLIQPGQPLALSRTLGQDCMAKIKTGLRIAEQLEHAIVLDLTGVEQVNGSFLKATVFWAMQCGQADVREKMTGRTEPWSVRPIKLYPVITGCSGDVEDDVKEFFSGRGVPILNFVTRPSDKPAKTCILGSLDPILGRTLQALASKGECTAADLATGSNEGISVNAWNNRLADLHLLRLATRYRKGKFHIYNATSGGILSWD